MTAIKRINKKLTKQAIFDKCDSSIAYSIDKKKFDEKIRTDKDYLDACKFVNIEPIYQS